MSEEKKPKFLFEPRGCLAQIDFSSELLKLNEKQKFEWETHSYETPKQEYLVFLEGYVGERSSAAGVVVGFAEGHILVDPIIKHDVSFDGILTNMSDSNRFRASPVVNTENEIEYFILKAK